MLKILLAAAPYLLKASQSSEKQKARSFTALVLFALSGVMISAAIFVYLTSIYGAAVGFVSLSTFYLIVGLILVFKARKAHSTSRNLVSKDTKISTEIGDPMASFIPDAVLKDPAVTKILDQIKANPIATTLAAATIGMMLTREFMKDHND